MNSEQESKVEQLAKEIWRQTIGKERGITDKGVAAPKTHAPPAVSSGEWVEELAERWERRASRYGEFSQSRVCSEIRRCLNELRACAESSSNDGSSATGELRETFDADKTKQTDGSR